MIASTRAAGTKIYTDDYQEGDGAGIKTATLEIEGPYAYGYLKAEVFMIASTSLIKLSRDFLEGFS